MKKYLFITLLAAFAASCAVEEIPQTGDGGIRVTSITVSLPQTKVAVDETDGKCLWEEEDRIAVWDASASRYVEFTLTEGAGKAGAVFSANGIVDLTDGADMVYPSSYAYSIAKDGEPVLNVPNVLDHSSDSKVPVVLRGNVSMKGDMPSGTFSHELGIIKFTLHDVPAYAAGFVLKSESEALAGLFQDGSYVPSYSSKAIKFSFPYKTGYNYSTDNDGDADPDDAVIYVALPAGTYNGLSVYFIDGDGDIIEGTQKKMKSAALAAGDYVIMPVLDLKKSQLRKDYVKVIGVKWAKGNLVRDYGNDWNTVQEGVDDGFQTGWGLHDEQYKYVNWDGSLNTDSGKYSNTANTLFDHFNFGGIGRLAQFCTGGMLVPASTSITGKVYSFSGNYSFPQNLDTGTYTELTGDDRFTAAPAKTASNVTLDGKTLCGDVAFWASKGKYRIPHSVELKNLVHSTGLASYQFGYITVGGVKVHGVLFTTPLGDRVTSLVEKEFSEADLESGLFLPKAGRRGPMSGTRNNNYNIINQGSQGCYRSGNFGAGAAGSHWNATIAEMNSSTETSKNPNYGYTHGTVLGSDGKSAGVQENWSDEQIMEVFVDNTFSNRAGFSIRPVLVDGLESIPGDVTPLPASSFDVKVGEPLPAWSEGCLDIHAINSGRGECTFFVLPDGTSLCVDAGEIAPSGGEHPRVDAKPDADTRAYKVYSEYIKAYLPKGDTLMDYMLMTHFHNDHFGTTNSTYEKTTRDGRYTYPLTGIMALYDEVPFDKIIDRAFDEKSDYKTVVESTGQDYNPGYGYYEQFITWARDSKGLVVEKAVNGSLSQLALVNNPSGYPDFKIQINAVNGWYWNGSKSVDAYSLNRLLGKQPSENGNSISFLLSYGDFDYLTSGDAGANTNIENNLARSINRKIEAMKAHHHFAWETMSETSMEIYQPTVVVSHCFYDHQPDMGHQWMCGDTDYTGTSTQAFQTAWNAYSGEKHWFFTNIHPTTASTYPYEVAKMASQNGHVVIRVAKNAEFYYVYVLDDTDMNYNVKSIHGPFTCHK